MASAGAYAGVLLMLGPFAITVGRASVLPLLMAACFALYLVLTRLMRDETTASRMFYTGVERLGSVGLVLSWAWTTPTLRDFGLMASIGGALGFLFLLGLDHALDAAPVGRLATFVLAQPIWTVVINAVVGGGGQAPARHAVVGIVIVLGAWLVFAWPERLQVSRFEDRGAARSWTQAPATRGQRCAPQYLQWIASTSCPSAPHAGHAWRETARPAWPALPTRCRSGTAMMA